MKEQYNGRHELFQQFSRYDSVCLTRARLWSHADLQPLSNLELHNKHGLKFCTEGMGKHF